MTVNEDSLKSRGAPDAARWTAIEAAFDEADRLAGPEHAAFLGALKSRDPSLYEEVEALLAARGPWWIDEPIGALPPPPEQAGDRIGAYELVQLLGRGGMGDVWLAVREGTDFRQYVALKILRPGLESADLRASLRAERQILGSLNHPNITHLLDVGETRDGRPYLVLEFVEGVPLTEYCNAHELVVEERLKLFLAICEAVRYAHRNLVVHHDLKPSNVLVTKDGIPKLLDFGIAKVLSPEFGAGPRLRASQQMRLFDATSVQPALTPGYAAPEQLAGRPTTTATDIYALGVVLYELLAGDRPYHAAGRTREELLRLIEQTPLQRPSAAAPGSMPRHLARDLDAIVSHALAIRPDERYSSVEALGADIERALDRRPVRARPRTMSYVASRLVQRHRVGVTVATLGTVVLVAFVTTILRQSIAMRERSARLERERERAVGALEILKRDRDATSAIAVDALDTLGSASLRENNPRRAIQYYEQSLAIRRTSLGSTSLPVAQSLFNLAVAHEVAGNHTDALARYRESLAIRLAALGADDPTVKATQDAIAKLSR